MKKIIALSALLSISNLVYSDTLNCKDLYVGKIQVVKGEGLKGAVFLNHPQNSSGSYWVWFNDWTESDKASALSLLMAAKISGHTVDIITNQTNGCDIQTGQRQMNNIILSNNS